MNRYVFECDSCDASITIKTSAGNVLSEMGCPVCIGTANLAASVSLIEKSCSDCKDFNECRKDPSNIKDPEKKSCWKSDKFTDKK